MRMQEGLQYFVNRITFVGNSTTHDTVIRRQMRLAEDGVFNTEALKSSIKLLNQLGYFKPLEGGKDVDVQKTANETNKVDVRVKLEEQNRNQLTFGAGVSQFEGFFGQLSFQTSNFMGRGESLTVSLQAGSLAQNYTLGFTEPFLFDRNMTGGVQLFKHEIHYINQFTQKTTGGTVTFGVPLGNFTRMFANYSYQHVSVSELQHGLYRPDGAAPQPVPAGFAAHRPGRRAGHQQDHAEPRAQHGGQPDLPDLGQARTRCRSSSPASAATPTSTSRISRASGSGSRTRGCRSARTPTSSTSTSSRGPRRCRSSRSSSSAASTAFAASTSAASGRRDPLTGLVLGGNKSLLFNLEQSITIAGPVRAILFYDAGQVRDTGERFSWWEDIRQPVVPSGVILTDPNQPLALIDPNAPPPQFTTVGRQSAFKTSTGVEIRFFMPVLNVPFRLIFYYDPQRGGVRDNNLQPQQAYGFRFAVGSTF